MIDGFLYIILGGFYENAKTQINRNGERTPIEFELSYLVNTGGMLWQRRD